MIPVTWYLNPTVLKLVNNVKLLYNNTNRNRVIKTKKIAQFRAFANEHDHLPAFHATYLVATVLAAVMLNLGVFAILIGLHMLLDVIKYRDANKCSWGLTCRAVIHENLIDLTLLMVALVFSVYFHHFVGLVGVSGFLRAEMSIMRLLGTIIPKIAIFEHLLKVASHIHHYVEQMRPGFIVSGKWSSLDKIFGSFIAVAILLLFFAPIIMNADPSVIRWIVMWELTPWNF